MPYIDKGVVHDADAHIMETAEFLAQFASGTVRDHILGIDGSARVATSASELESVLARQADPAYRARDAEEIMLRKNWAATGALLKEDRPAALDMIGVASQLVFNTFINGHLAKLEKHSDDVDLIYGVADAHNRAMLDFPMWKAGATPSSVSSRPWEKRAPRTASVSTGTTSRV